MSAHETHGDRCRIFKSRDVSGNALALTARIVEVMRGFRINHDVDIVAHVAALRDEHFALPWRYLLIGRSYEHPHRRIRNVSSAEPTLQPTARIEGKRCAEALIPADTGGTQRFGCHRCEHRTASIRPALQTYPTGVDVGPARQIGASAVRV